MVKHISYSRTSLSTDDSDNGMGAQFWINWEESGIISETDGNTAVSNVSISAPPPPPTPNFDPLSPNIAWAREVTHPEEFGTKSVKRSTTEIQTK